MSVTLTVPVMEASLNAAAGSLSGTGPANAWIGVTRFEYDSWGGYVQRDTYSVRTNASGAFSLEVPLATNGDRFDLRYCCPAIKSTSSPRARRSADGRNAAGRSQADPLKRRVRQ